MRKTVLIALCLSMVAMEAQAISRYNSASMSCAKAKAIVRGEGAAILRWRSNGIQRFGRFVANGRFCAGSERAESSYVPTADRKSCPLLECKYYSPDDDYLFRFRRRGRSTFD